MATFILPQHGQISVDRIPDECPICHTRILPLMQIGRLTSGKYGYGARVEIVYLCPNSTCDELFIAYFKPDARNALSLSETRPMEPSPLIFTDSVRQISPTFCNIYTEADKAEKYGLPQVCGVGYRKALEFLIKDFVISLHPNDRTAIEASMLGACIKTYVTDAKTKQVAERAVWLGNDETHYQRRWINKDLADLKTMISLVTHWIEMEHLTAEALNSMPPDKG
jgi:hypothetical protein